MQMRHLVVTATLALAGLTIVAGPAAATRRASACRELLRRPGRQRPTRKTLRTYQAAYTVSATSITRNDIKNTTNGTPFTSFVADNKRHLSSLYTLGAADIQWRVQGKDDAGRKFNYGRQLLKNGHPIVTNANVCPQNPVVSEGHAGLIALSSRYGRRAFGAFAIVRRRRLRPAYV